MTWFVPLVVISAILITPIAYIFIWFTDKRRIRAYLERRGATQIVIRLHAVIPVHRGWFSQERRSKRVYQVNYVAATGQAKATFCTSSNGWWEGREITWNDTGSDRYDLVPTAKLHTLRINSPQVVSPRSYYNPLTMRKSQQK